MIEITVVYWIKILTTLVIFSILIVVFLRRGNKRLKVSGVELVEVELCRLGENYKVFNNLIIKLEQGMLRIDHVVASSYGVFVLTRCDRVGKISGHKNDREWKVKSIGGEDTILNPIWENRKHINALEKKIGSRPFIPVVVFTHAKLLDDFGPITVNVGHLHKFFIKHTKILVRNDDLERLANILNKFKN